MRNCIMKMAALMLSVLSCGRAADTFPFEPVDYVSTLVGTQSDYGISTGNTYPAVAVPWGTNFWTPQTGRNGDGWAYTYTSARIRGIKQTHQPSPWINDYGEFSLMPVTAGEVFDEDARQSWFSHKAETARPYYYSVYLADHDVTAEVTPTSHAAVFRFTYPEKDTSYLVVDAFDGGSSIEVSGNRITGYSVKNSGGVAPGFRNYFVIESDTPFTYSKVVDDDGHAMAVVGFRTAKGQKVEMKAASSFISAGQALQNMKEVEGKGFDSVCAAARSRWNEVLGRIRVEDDDIDRLRTFYSCLYRCVLFPRDLSEVTADGIRVHYSPFSGNVEEGYFFTDTGFLDTFRALLPLVNLVYPDMSAKIQEGLVNTYRESGFLPEWASPGHRNCMVGNNSASVVADAFVSGASGYDAGTLWEAVVHGAHAVHPRIRSTGRLGWEQYDSLGYVPCDIGYNETAARTLEYAYDDWCIYTFGKALGKSEEELSPYARSAFNYKNVYDAENGLMNGRASDGSFRRPFSPLKWGGDFTEGNSLHYTWSVFHDIQGLIGLMGGKDKFNAALDGVFEMPPLFDDSYYGGTIHEIREMQIMGMGNYAHGNQPIQHMLYLYDYSGQPWKTQARVREVMDRFYTAAPDGYCGDEDNGQTSAWYVFSAMGFYPVCPASGQYAIGTPLFRKVTVEMPSGKKIEILAKDNSRSNFYIGAMKVNGRSWDNNYLEQKTLQGGARLDFSMSAEPSKTRGVSQEAVPYSFSTAE